MEPALIEELKARLSQYVEVPGGATRAGRSLANVVYVGDGVWDLKASRDLGVRFVGTGTRSHLLKAAGAQHILEVLEETLFLSAVQAARRLRDASGPIRPQAGKMASAGERPEN